MKPRPYQRAAIAVEKYARAAKDERFPVEADDIEKILKRYIITDTAWRNAFVDVAKELGVKTSMSHCSESTFAVLKAIKELKERSK